MSEPSTTQNTIAEPHVSLIVSLNRRFAAACLAEWKNCDGIDRSWMLQSNSISLPRSVLKLARKGLSEARIE